jgi:hypothetical protein
MLRPELVQNNEVPLNPDAFSMFLKYDPNKQQSLVEVLLSYLFEDLILFFISPIIE